MKEYLKVKECFNPVIVQTKKATCHRALYPNDPLLQPNQEMIAQTQFLPSLIRKNSDLADKMRELFSIKKGKTGKRRFADANKPSSQELSLEEILNKPEEHKNGKRAKSDDGITTDALIQHETIREENETSRFNDFLKELKTTCFMAQPSKTDFWDLIIREKITLISRDEAPDSTTSIQEAEEKSNDTLDEDAVATDDLVMYSTYIIRRVCNPFIDSI
ncbi:9376_t:CDS:2 [Racocetra fulgida]|uniref:9376_t:CDS:1 n=1 Tax=Racocetra fulgida TaxID=60492 RepID=A0A9N9NDJ8_9GLOM|nr:9376_t:CDS:2 [Racocetra fulgida]